MREFTTLNIRASTVVIVSFFISLATGINGRVTPKDRVTITTHPYGKTNDGQDVNRYTFKNKNNMEVSVTNYGGILTNILVPDRHGNVDDVLLGFDTIHDYETRNVPHFGSLIGRYINRIKGAQFVLDGKTYHLIPNDGNNTIHGGPIGFDKKVWGAHVIDKTLVLTYVSADGEEGFPGQLNNTVTYELTDDNEFILDYTATTNKPTIINLSNHAYFNLAGQGKENNSNHYISVYADYFVPTDKQNLPTGQILSVENTPMDLRKPVRVGDRNPKAYGGNGFDHNFCLKTVETRKLAARLEHRTSGRFLEVYTTQPGVQFYTSGNLDDTVGKGGVTYRRFDAVSLETQHYPDSVHHANFPSTVLRPGDTYRQISSYKLGLIN